MLNLISDVSGLLVGNAHDENLLSGVTALIFEEPATASIAIHGGAPGVRDGALLEPDMTVEKIDALVLSGGSAFGLDAPGGVQGFMREQGRGFTVGEARIPIVPGAILFDLINGGDKNWGRKPPYWELGYAAAAAAAKGFSIGSIGAGFGATTANLRGGLGSASARTSAGFVVGALVAVNAIGSATIGDGPHFWAAPYERDGEFGGLGLPAGFTAADLALQLKGAPAPPKLENTTIAVVATDAALSKAQAKRLAVIAHDGMARALRPSHAAMDGDLIFAAATGRAAREASLPDQIEIGALAADCLARAIARAIYSADAATGAGSKPGWRQRFINQNVRHTS
ncbi:P1 family peptidase [Roseiarcaceae bacterium H3SJ34-1]|uniref:P1 family peptidase n=1 Tax=Terripilifer ovatus TaxID=3032367 RepID=UPI003AB94FDC|nr:P1 family peptidase [Roseiarcaceae bacterium H3SJ34-1]